MKAQNRSSLKIVTLAAALLALAGSTSAMAASCDQDAVAKQAILDKYPMSSEVCTFDIGRFERTPTLSLISTVDVTCRFEVIPISHVAHATILRSTYEVILSRACTAVALQVEPAQK